MNIRSLTSELSYRGEVESKRQTYYVFEGKRHYFVMSLSRAKPNAGNFNVVSAEAVDAVAKRFKGRKTVTSKDVAKSFRAHRGLAKPLVALNVLYVLAATDRAKIDSRFKEQRQLFFNVAG